MIDLANARKHFKNTDPIMYALLAHTETHERPLRIPSKARKVKYFENIVETIVSQQLSVKAADTIYARLKALSGTITPVSIGSLSESSLRSVGLSGQKANYMIHNARAWGDFPTHRLENMSDEDVIESLTKLRGIGRWSAEMFLMFSLARPDVFSYGDLGLVQSLEQHYSLRPHWKKKKESIVNAWSPHRTVASLVLWHQRDNRPL